MSRRWFPPFNALILTTLVRNRFQLFIVLDSSRLVKIPVGEDQRLHPQPFSPSLRTHVLSLFPGKPFPNHWVGVELRSSDPGRFWVISLPFPSSLLWFFTSVKTLNVSTINKKCRHS